MQHDFFGDQASMRI